MNKLETATTNLLPQPFVIHVYPYQADLIDNVQSELEARATADPNGCFGYFPGATEMTAVDSDLPASQALADALDNLHQGRRLSFNFIRLALREQEALAPFHLDSDMATGLGANNARIGKKKVWRALLNLSSDLVRHVAYINVDPKPLPLVRVGNYLQCPPEHVPNKNVRTVAIEPRQRTLIHGSMFCVSHVLHAGQDGERGHFIASYGSEETR